MGKQPTFGDATTGFPAKWRLRNERTNSILMTRHYPDLGSASHWSCHVGNLIQPIRSTTRIWVVMRHQYGTFALASQTAFGGETQCSVAKCRLFSLANNKKYLLIWTFVHTIDLDILDPSSILTLSQRCTPSSWTKSPKINNTTTT